MWKDFERRIDHGDVLLTEVELWLDPHQSRDFAFVSHAHSDHVAPHSTILCSAPTRRLIEARYGSVANSSFLSPEFGETLILKEQFQIEMLPSGHIPGSAMLHLTRLSDGVSLLHTGDFKTRPAPGAEPNTPRRADVLIMETTFGLPKFRFPAVEVVIAAMVKFVREAIEDGEVPIFMAYSLGKAQEILLRLSAYAPELKFQVHESVAKMNAEVTSLGYQLPPCTIFAPAERSPLDHVVVLPPSAARSLAVRRMRKSVRLAMVSGWGMDAGAKFRYQCDEVFPLSDHADYEDLLDFVRAVGPQRVFTIHGYTSEFAATLRGRGIEAWPLVGAAQLELDLSDEVGVEDSRDRIGLDGKPDPIASSLPDSEFGRLAALSEEIASFTGKRKKQERIATYLVGLTNEALVVAVRFLSGRTLSRHSEHRSVKVGSALIRQALLEVSGLTLPQYRKISQGQADTARTAWLVLQNRTRPQSLTLAEVDTALERLAAESSQSAKVKLLCEALLGISHREGALLVGILTGDLRIGLKEGLLEEAIAIAFGQKPAEVREANLLLGDLGEVALMAKERTLNEAEAAWFTPLKVMLASPEESAGDLISRLGGKGAPLWLEDKFDGIRAQLHRRGREVEIYSRDLRSLGEEFPELVEAARGLDRDVILDGEIIAYAEGKRLGFFDLQKRLGRRDLRIDQGDLFLGEAIPVRFVAFDLLGIDARACLDRPLSERRQLLESVTFPPAMECCEVHRAETEEEVEALFKAARLRDNEGLVAKDPGSSYTPGRRGKQWLKLKKAMPTLDVVVVKAQQGHGKRSHVLSDYTFSVRDEASGALRIIGKAYSGLTDLEIEELTSHFLERTIGKVRGVHTLIPDTVLEIAFDSIRPSKRHDSGLAMRFPRIKAIRRDKTIAEIDTLAYALKLAGL